MGGSGAVLGAKIARFTLWQGGSLLVSNLLHAASIVYVAHQLGAADLGIYTLLLFWSGLITQVFHIFSKPGTLRRVFGQADDEDAGSEGDFDSDDEDQGVQSTNPERTLGVGIIWVSLLGLIGGGLTILFREPIAQMLLHDPHQSNLIFWTGILGGVGALFKLCDIVIWFERRPLMFIFVDASRPTMNLLLMAYFIRHGQGVEGAIKGAAIGTSIATAISVIALLRSFRAAWDPGELKLIIQRGMGRVPIAMSMWTIQNADSFILSRYVDHTQVGYYKFAQNLGLIVSFLPQGFRIAMRPLRKSAVFEAVKRQYGAPVAQAQLLSYFLILSMAAVLLMVMGGNLLINQANSKFEAARPLIPLTAAALTMPALLRTVNGQTAFPHKRGIFIACAIWAAVSFVGLMSILVPAFGIIGTPISMLGAFGSSVIFLWIKGQRGRQPLDFHYKPMIAALLLAAAIAEFNRYVHPANKWLQLAEVALLMGLWIFLLFALRIIPEYHRAPIWHIIRSTLARRPHGFDRDAGLRALRPKQLDLLHDAVVNRIPTDEFGGDEVRLNSSPQGRLPLVHMPHLHMPHLHRDEKLEMHAANGGGQDGSGNGDGSSQGNGAEAGNGGRLGPQERSVPPQRLVKILRKVGEEGGVPVGERTEFDAKIAKFLFADAPTATRNATARSLIAAGAESNDIRTLDDLVEYLAKSPKEIWRPVKGRRASPRGG